MIAETAAGDVVAIQVTAALTVNRTDFRHLVTLQEKIGTDFTRGRVVHHRQDFRSFGDRLTAVPLSALWQCLPARTLRGGTAIRGR